MASDSVAASASHQEVLELVYAHMCSDDPKARSGAALDLRKMVLLRGEAFADVARDPKVVDKLAQLVQDGDMGVKCSAFRAVCSV